MLSGTGLCDGLITRPEESHRLWCVLACDRGTSSQAAQTRKGCKSQIEEIIVNGSNPSTQLHVAKS